MPRNRDPLWEYVEQEDGKVTCKFCGKKFNGGITRIRHHLAKSESEGISKCPNVSTEVHGMAREGVQQLGKGKGKKERISDDRMAPTNSSSCSLTQLDSRLTQRIKKLKTDLSVINFIDSNKLASDLLEDPKFKEMCAAIADAGQGYEPPSFEMDKTNFLGDLETEVEGYVQSIKQSWEKFGCTLLLETHHTDDVKHLYLFAACPKGVVYRGSLVLEIDGMEDEDVKVLDFVSSAIDEMGPQNIIQILNNIDYHSIFEKVEQRYPNIFLSRFTCDYFNEGLLLLEDLYEPFFIEVHAIRQFVKQHFDVLHQKNGCELIYKLCENVERRLAFVIREERELLSMVASTEWRELIQCDEQGVKIQKIIEDNRFWNSSRKLFRVIECMAKIWRMSEDNNSTSGYLYVTFIKLEEAIKQSFEEDSEKNSSILDFIHEKLAPNSMQVAAAYLNPQLFYDGLVEMNAKVQNSLNDIIERMKPSEANMEDLVVQLDLYNRKHEKIFSPLAKISLRASHPRIWWEMWGHNAKILQKLAIKLLSQPCVNSPYESKWIDFFDDEHDPENEIPFDVRLNMRLMNTYSQMEQQVDKSPIDFEKIEKHRVCDFISYLYVRF
ncbi:hypothetical protein QJS04_geneDACA019957 [Acorus gramineus]|uniref:BED-type domain-containing protein n=1 Tax=Acorus gramineus TaxID=55184 RepID=A0AAV9B2Y0_ACOGR|nr:hypothetical protein QJS04_geneDACA019957 [Acorus gramineus]